MTYQRANSSPAFAAPEAVAFAFPAPVSSPTTGTTLAWTSVTNVYQTSGVTVSSGALVLPAGSWYYLEGTAQAISGTYDTNDFLSYRWRNDTAGAYSGSLGRVAFNATSSDALLHSYDERAVTLIYASTQLTVSLRCQTNSGCTWANYQNAAGESQIVATGFGRALIIKLSGAAP